MQPSEYRRRGPRRKLARLMTGLGEPGIHSTSKQKHGPFLKAFLGERLFVGAMPAEVHESGRLVIDEVLDYEREQHRSHGVFGMLRIETDLMKIEPVAVLKTHDVRHGGITADQHIGTQPSVPGFI